MYLHISNLERLNLNEIDHNDSSVTNHIVLFIVLS